MNFSRRSRFEDLLFVVALLVPAVFSGARFIESEHQMTQIAQAKAQSTALAATQTPVNPIIAQVDLRAP